MSVRIPGELHERLRRAVFDRAGGFTSMADVLRQGAHEVLRDLGVAEVRGPVVQGVDPAVEAEMRLARKNRAVIDAEIREAREAATPEVFAEQDESLAAKNARNVAAARAKKAAAKVGGTCSCEKPQWVNGASGMTMCSKCGLRKAK